MFLRRLASVFNLEDIRTAMRAHEPELVAPKATTRQAAVAIILRENTNGPEMLFIKRAEKPGDPWSGHMAFPGGHKDPEDNSLEDAARRETWEETGFSLEQSRYLGALDHQQAQPRGRVLDMLIAPHVFEIDGDPQFTPNYEVDEVVWASLPAMANNELHDTETKLLDGNPTIFNGYRLSSRHFVWGLTYRMLKTFFYTLNPSWQPPNEL